MRTRWVTPVTPYSERTGDRALTCLLVANDMHEVSLLSIPFLGMAMQLNAINGVVVGLYVPRCSWCSHVGLAAGPFNNGIRRAYNELYLSDLERLQSRQDRGDKLHSWQTHQNVAN